MFPSEHSSSSSRQPEGRGPLQPMPVNPPAAAPGGVQQTGQGYPATWSPSKVSSSNEGYRPENIPVESFELEDNNTDNNTTNSGGTSWTLRIPWLRNKRHRRIRQDDENSSIQTNQSRSITTQPGTSGGGGGVSPSRRDDPESLYYGGLMRTTSPSSVYEEANNAVDGLHHHHHHPHMRQHPDASLLQEQHPAQLAASKLRGSGRNSHLAANRPDRNLLPQHNPPPPPPNTPAGNNSHRYSMSLSGPAPLEHKNTNKVFRNRSWISTSSNGSNRRKRRQQKNGNSTSTDDDSLQDFDETEWTPQDSAYGAAIPICGWVPKRLRQFIEATLIGITVFALVYLVVTTSINIQESKEASGKPHTYYNGSYVDSNFDDDWYVEFSQYTNDEDDYFNSDTNNAAGGDDGGG